MNYQQTLSWLFSQLPMYQREGKSAYKADLSNTIDLDNYLGNPHYNYPSIHIAGTNGKGSTCHMISSILQEAGYNVGLYTSPHLKDFRERIKINGEPCSKTFVIQFIEDHRDFFESRQLSFFEMTVGMAFQYFKQEHVDIAVIETGLGGRLDSTNIITPLVCGITNIEKDHTAILGNTLVKIAAEKAGIIKKNVPVIIGEQRKHLRSRFRESARNKKAPLTFINHSEHDFSTDLLGAYQSKNTKMAAAVIEKLAEISSFKVSDRELNKGLLNVVLNTKLRGRYEVLQLQPKVVCDTAHNVAGLTAVLQQVKKEVYRHLHIVIGVVNDKNLDLILKLLPRQATYHISKPNIPRGLETRELAKKMNDHQLTFFKYPSVPLAYQGAVLSSDKRDLILVTGSTFVVAEVL